MVGSKSAAAEESATPIRFLEKYILPSDAHAFVGRLFDLSIAVFHFDSREDLEKQADCKYVMEVNYYLTKLVRRVESLNIAGAMLWPQTFSKANYLPVSRYEWLTIAADVFLIRYVSVLDCSLHLVNGIFEFGLPSRDCTLSRLKKFDLPEDIIGVLDDMSADQGRLRSERNSRVHQGEERAFTDDDLTFYVGAVFERGSGIRGTDRYGRSVNIERSFREGLVALQREFNSHTRQLICRLDRLYDLLSDEFESRLEPHVRASVQGSRMNAATAAQAKK